jgi:hypothetical protein
VFRRSGVQAFGIRVVALWCERLYSSEGGGIGIAQVGPVRVHVAVLLDLPGPLIPVPVLVGAFVGVHQPPWLEQPEVTSDFLLLVTNDGRGTGWWTTEQILLCFDRGKIDPVLELTESEFNDWDPQDNLERMTIEDTQLHLVSNLSFQNWPILRTHTIKQTDYYRDPGGDDEKKRHLSHSIVTTGEAEYRFDPRIWKYRRVWQRGRTQD